MPLHLSRLDETEDDTPDSYAVLTGGCCVGTFKRLSRGESEGDWFWWVGFPHTIDDGGRAGTARGARNAIAVSFRRQLARFGLAEVEGSRTPPILHRLASPAAAGASTSRYGRHIERPRARVSSYPRIARITSGDLPVGVLREVEITPSARHWTWAISGIQNSPSNLIWNGCTSSFEESQDALLCAWSSWLAWAGLRQIRALKMSPPTRSMC